MIQVYRYGWRSKGEISWELEFVDHLANNGASVARCVKRKDGRWFSEIQAIEGVRQVAVFQCAPGSYTHFGNNVYHRVSPVKCAEQFGSSMAEIHAAADTFRSTMPRFHLDLDVWDRFKLGYISRRSLSDVDLSVVRVFAGIRVLWLMGLWCSNAQKLGYHQLHDDYFDRELTYVNGFYNEAVRPTATSS